jgi:4-nitrophenyl phosphatase
LKNKVDIRGLILDMDGVLWKDTEPIGNLPLVFKEIQKRQLKYVLATNNSTRTPEQYQLKLAEFGVTIDTELILTSANVAANFVKINFPGVKKAFVVGEEGLERALKSVGIGVTQDDPEIVVVGMDRYFSYDKLRKATLLIRAGAGFIGTNPDRTFPAPEGLVPGAGSILAAIEVASDRKPMIVGKPEKEIYRLAMEVMETIPENTLVVGDRLETDILGGQTLGCHTALVLSGVTNCAQSELWQPKPDLISSDLLEVIKHLDE